MPSPEECQAGFAQLTTHVRTFHPGKPASLENGLRTTPSECLQAERTLPITTPPWEEGRGLQDKPPQGGSNLCGSNHREETPHTGLGSGVDQGPLSASVGLVQKGWHENFATCSLSSKHPAQIQMTPTSQLFFNCSRDPTPHLRPSRSHGLRGATPQPRRTTWAASAIQ